MLIKAADSRADDISALERLRARPDLTPLLRDRVLQRLKTEVSGAKNEADVAYKIELYFGRSNNWVTIHGLRFEVGGYAAQIDHLLINRLAEIWVCESKHFAERVRINERGEWTASWQGHEHGLESPVEQVHRQLHLLGRLFEDGLVRPPRRLGLLPLRPRLRSLVLVSNNAIIERPATRTHALDEVLKADQLKSRVFDEFDKASTFRFFGLIGVEGLAKLGREIAALHKPLLVDWESQFGL